MKNKTQIFLTLIFIISCTQQQQQEQIEQTGVVNMKLTSPAFTHNGAIP